MWVRWRTPSSSCYRLIAFEQSKVLLNLMNEPPFSYLCPSNMITLFSLSLTHCFWGLSLDLSYGSISNIPLISFSGLSSIFIGLQSPLNTYSFHFYWFSFALVWLADWILELILSNRCSTVLLKLLQPLLFCNFRPENLWVELSGGNFDKEYALILI